MTPARPSTPGAHAPGLRALDARADQPLLEASGVSLGYAERTVLSDVNFTIRQGEYWFFLGPNGAGKSTLLRSILGGIPARSGLIRRRPDIASPDRLGYVPQRCELNPTLPTTMREFVSLGLAGIRGAEPGRLAWALERANLRGMERRDYWSLSGGQRQRAMLARALIRRPALFIVDEPTTGLDPPSADLLMRSIDELHTAERLTTIFVTHDLPLAAKHATHVALFLEGTIHAGPADQVLVPPLLERAYGLPIELHLHHHTDERSAP
ncbi:MAG: metal ABC transporter ATP-binding protein [Phycisphaerales bacterium]|nr:metal ABC transporter ATP-binding protein [Phycisphaerales bacterium]